MSRLNDLIAELCPDGVEHKMLWEVTAWDKKFNAVDNYKQPKVVKYYYYLANDLKHLNVENGNVKILTTNTSALFTTEKLAGDNICEGEIVAIPWGGNPNVQYYKGKFLTADNRIATSVNSEYLDNKYLYYFLQNSLETIGSFYRGSGIRHPDMSKVLNILIPLPSLTVQHEIVQILDKFTTLEAELETELEARRKQYEYYRDELLTFGDVVPIDNLGNVCSFVRGPFGGSLKKECFVPQGYAVYEQQHAIYGDFTFRYFVTEKKYSEMKRFSVKPGDLIMSCSGTMGKISIIPENAKKGIINQALLKLTVNNKINNKFLKYYFESTAFWNYLNSHTQGGAIKNVASVAVLKTIPTPIPPLAEQARIVAILDHFNTLVNDITQGLPAEIAARHMQYEYYRDKLLTFKEKVS